MPRHPKQTLHYHKQRYSQICRHYVRLLKKNNIYIYIYIYNACVRACLRLCKAVELLKEKHPIVKRDSSVLHIYICIYIYIYMNDIILTTTPYYCLRF